MTDDRLLHDLIGADGDHRRALLVEAASSTRVAVLVAAAVLSGAGDLLTRAACHAATSRERQLVALAAAHLAGDDDRFDALVRDHLADHPDHVVAAWVAAVHAAHRHPTA